jgi:CHAT domain-containing protein
LDKNSNGHLEAADLANLLEESRPRAESAVRASDLHAHLAACPACRKQFEELVSLDYLLGRQVKSARPAESPHNGDCPDQAVWREIAGGLTPANETLAHIEHASRCDSCGPLLREAVAELTDLNRDITAAERQHIAALQSASAEWQQRLAQRIAGTAHSGDSAPWWRWKLAVPRLASTMAAVILLAAVVGVGWWVVVQRNQPATAGHLLARAYTEQRTLELRIAGADYAPLRVSRGPAASFTSRSQALLKAEDLIASQLESHPSDPSWLHAQAQADLLEGKYDAAVEALRRALELQPDSSALMTDLATAYFQRAQQEDRKDDLGAAYEYLSQALKLRPDDPVALLKKHESNATPLRSPAQVADAASSASLGVEVDQRVEEYLQEAVRSWLPQAFPEGGAQAKADPQAAQALFFLADLTSRQHGDLWLSDLLRGSSAPSFPPAVTALARAVKANGTGEYDVSRAQSDLAEKLFRAHGNTAGVLRAQFEWTFAAQIERHSEECRRRASVALAQSEKYSYSWLQIQLELEKGVCSFLMGDIGTDEKGARQAMELAEKNGYGALYLRALSFAEADQIAIGDQAGAWNLASTGLGRYWSGEFPAMRGYNVYYAFGYALATARQPYLLMAIWREAGALIDSDENLLVRAWAHSYMANAAAAVHQPEIAAPQYAEAARLFALAPRTEASRGYALETEIRIARVEARLGHFDTALARLASIQDQIRPLSNNYLVQMFYSTLGELQLRRHREAEAEQALQPALALAEHNLATLRSESERTNWSKDAAPAYLALVEAELAQGRSQDALETYEWYLGAPQRTAADSRPHRSAADPPMPSPSQMASRLPLLAKETVLAFAVLPDGLAIWAYDNRGINARWIQKPTDSLRELAERFQDLASDPKSERTALRRDARSLYEALIAPVEQHLEPGRTLVIEADGWMARVPFEALLDSNDHYLIERAPVAHSLGQDSQARLRNDTGISRDLPALVVGSTASSPADGLIPLPDVSAEADAVASGFHSVRVLRGEEATLTAVRNELPMAAVFHFAGHSLAAPQSMGLLLEREGEANAPRVLDAAALRQLRLQSLQLAVLSACSTASGSGGSSGFDSVTDSLLRAGVPHVVASRWTVDSVETRGFVEDFYHNALSGQPVSGALRQTALKMLANPRTAHPYYWSAFSAYGRP